MATKKQGASRRQHEKVTARDVARLAGVSSMTVSRVINGEPSVRQSTRGAVNRAIDELGYSPNKAARSLASASQIQIGLLYDNPSSAYLSAMLLGVLEQARRSDTQIVLVECEAEADATRAIRSLLKSGVDGIFLSPPLADAIDVLMSMKRSGLQAVTIGTQHPDLGIPSVSIDDCLASRAMTEHIISLGHERIGFITGNPVHRSTDQRLAGFHDALKAAGLKPDKKLIEPGRYSYRSGLGAADRLLKLDPRPTAIFASNDDMAAATIATAHRYHIDVPRDLTVCGFDDTLLATTIWPGVTTIHQPIAEMAHAGIEILEKNIRSKRAGIAPDIEHLTLEYQIVSRESDGPPLNAARG